MFVSTCAQRRAMAPPARRLRAEMSSAIRPSVGPKVRTEVFNASEMLVAVTACFRFPW